MTDRTEDQQSTKGAYVESGAEFTRDTNYIPTRITADGRDGYPVEPGRYRLVAARACPWANRAIIVRRLLGLEDVLSMGLCGPTHDERSWTFDLDPGGLDPVLKIPAPAGRVLRALPRLPAGHHRAGDRRRPHRAGGHQRLPADDAGSVLGMEAVPPRGRARPVPRGAARRDRRGRRSRVPRRQQRRVPVRFRRRPRTRTTPRTTACSPGSTGSRNVWPTAVPRRRHDHRGGRAPVHDPRPVRRGLPRTLQVQSEQARPRCPCCGRYARDLFQTPGFGDTIDFTQIKQHYYIVHTDLNPTGIVPKGPDLSGWLDAARA